MEKKRGRVSGRKSSSQEESAGLGSQGGGMAAAAAERRQAGSAEAHAIAVDEDDELRTPSPEVRV